MSAERIKARRTPALRAGLPFGAVMATGAASQLAAPCGQDWAVKLLLCLAIAAAVWITAYGIFRHRAEFRAPLSSWVAVGHPSEHSGVLTVPLGLAVITTAVAGQQGTVGSGAAGCGLVLAWLATLVFLPRFVVAVSRSPNPVDEVDGSWFLGPAVLLGLAISNVALIPLQTSGSAQDWLRASAVALATLGMLGYWVLLVVTAARVARRGFTGARPVLWWISAGCGGLAAASMSKALGAPGSHWAGIVATVLRPVTAATFVAAAVILIVILVQGVRFLAGACEYRQKALWPPTFSTAVFALGGLAAGGLLGSQSMVECGKYAGYLALIFWLVTVAWNRPTACPSSAS